MFERCTENTSLEARTNRQNKETQRWMYLATDDPLCKVTYTNVLGTNLYALDFTENQTTKEGVRNMSFEVVFPFYTCVSSIIDKRKTPKTAMIKLETSSRGHCNVKYSCEFTFETWCFVKMDEIISALAEQLTTKENLNRGLMMNISLYE